MAKFVDTYIDNKQMRDNLYHIWTTMRKFRPHLQVVKQLIIRHKIPVHFVFGAYDRIIRAEHGYKFQKGVEAFVKVEVLTTGHQLLKEKQAAAILKTLTQYPY
jgi:pimeloyl-ACP methyl ester carboxylesterase